MINISSFFSRIFKTDHPKEGILYTVTAGEYKGLIIVFFDLDKMPNDKKEYSTLGIGDRPGFDGGMCIFNIPEKAVVEGFKNKVLVKLNKLPKQMRNIFYKEYIERIQKNASID